MTRAAVRRSFLERIGWGQADVSPLAGDASFRSYYRIAITAGDETGASTRRAVLMDAPPPEEDVRPFIAVANHLRKRGFSAPEIIAAEIDRGFLLLEDLGDETFNRIFATNPKMECPLYDGAVDLLVSLHDQPAPKRMTINADTDYELPTYDLRALLDEARLFTDWYLPEIAPDHSPLAWQSLEALLTPSLEEVLTAAPVLTLRDYHVDNLMWLPDRAGLARIGPLDFQDALAGHPAYDLVSLLRDARRDVSPELEKAMITRYLNACPAWSRDQFEFAYALFGVQRNAKIIGIFTRLWKRDGKPGYLQMIPHVWGLLERSLSHPAFGDLKQWFDQSVPTEQRLRLLKAETD